MKTTRFAAVAAVIGFAMASSAPVLAATTLTFEGHPNTIYNAPITRSGFEIGNPAGQEQHFHEIDSTQFGLISNGTGILLNDRDSQIFLQRAGGGAFALTSFDIASSGGSNAGGTDFTVSGYLGGNFVGSVVGSLGSFATFAGFSNVDYVVFDGSGGRGGFELDNIVLDGAGAVPEPATWGMLVGGLAIAGASMRRRKVAVSLA